MEALSLRSSGVPCGAIRTASAACPHHLSLPPAASPYPAGSHGTPPTPQSPCCTPPRSPPTTKASTPSCRRSSTTGWTAAGASRSHPRCAQAAGLQDKLSARARNSCSWWWIHGMAPSVPPARAAGAVSCDVARRALPYSRMMQQWHAELSAFPDKPTTPCRACPSP
jgi:hypothetical protein